ncbi:hypothetical protein ACL9RL_13425 [Plantibacter sp. Mn2098]
MSNIHDNWDAAAEVSRLGDADKRRLCEKQVLPRAAFFDYEPHVL